MNKLVTPDVMEDHDWMRTDVSVEESGGHTTQPPCQPAFTEQVMHFKILTSDINALNECFCTRPYGHYISVTESEADQIVIDIA